MNLQYRKPVRTILDGLDNGRFDTEQVLIACLKYMSDDEILDMMRVNEFTEDDEQDTWEQSEYEPCPCEVCAAHG